MLILRRLKCIVCSSDCRLATLHFLFYKLFTRDEKFKFISQVLDLVPVCKYFRNGILFKDLIQLIVIFPLVHKAVIFIILHLFIKAQEETNGDINLSEQLVSFHQLFIDMFRVDLRLELTHNLLIFLILFLHLSIVFIIVHSLPRN